MADSNFSDTGLPIGENNVNMTYLYGLSDFFTMMFTDPSQVNLLLEATSQNAAEVYSRFLQLTSTISLEGISETVGSSIKLITLNSTAKVIGRTNVYTLPQTVLSSKCLANRPFLPTSLLDSDVDFHLVTDASGNTTVTFAKDIESYGFSARTNSSGSTDYALWFVDVNIDERLISKYYGTLIGVDPQNSTTDFHNFVYGLYYVYVQGPTLDILRKGFNLTLGIPLARSQETVIDIRNYLDTDQYIVITDQNQYIIPYGLPASVAVGDQLNVGDEIAKWVVIEDYLSKDGWWINLNIPLTIIPTQPAGQKDRYATAGSHFDYLMRNYLKKHTFLVNINVSNFENIQTYQQISDIIHRSKPAYTQPIYIWSVQTPTDSLTLDDSQGFVQRVDPSRCEPIGSCIPRFFRNNTIDPVDRGCPQLLRFNVPSFVSQLCGTDPYINGNSASLGSGDVVVTGVTNYTGRTRGNTDVEAAWINTIVDRGSEVWRGSRANVGASMSLDEPSDGSGVAVWLSPKAWNVPADSRVVPLYLTSFADIVQKHNTLGVPPPSPNVWSFAMFGANVGTQAINAIGINATYPQVSGIVLRNNYSLSCFRDPSVVFLGLEIPEKTGWQTFAPNSSDILDGDYLLGVKVTPKTVAVYWVTTNSKVVAAPYFVVGSIDPSVFTYSMPPTRGVAAQGSPYYALRGRGQLNYTGIGTAIDQSAINQAGSVGSPTLVQQYTDIYNQTNVTMDRSGNVYLEHAIELR